MGVFNCVPCPWMDIKTWKSSLVQEGAKPEAGAAGFRVHVGIWTNTFHSQYICPCGVPAGLICRFTTLDFDKKGCKTRIFNVVVFVPLKVVVNNFMITTCHFYLKVVQCSCWPLVMIFSWLLTKIFTVRANWNHSWIDPRVLGGFWHFLKVNIPFSWKAPTQMDDW